MDRTHISFRHARPSDLQSIVGLLADDPLGSRREALTSPLPEAYLQAFQAISADPNNELVVADLAGQVVGVMQLTFIAGISHRGGWRALVEGVRVSETMRSTGIGKLMLGWAIERARERGCRLVQLTSDKRRAGAIRFYESLGFVASHEGMKLQLSAGEGV